MANNDYCQLTVASKKEFDKKMINLKVNAVSILYRYLVAAAFQLRADVQKGMVGEGNGIFTGRLKNSLFVKTKGQKGDKWGYSNSKNYRADKPDKGQSTIYSGSRDFASATGEDEIDVGTNVDYAEPQNTPKRSNFFNKGLVKWTTINWIFSYNWCPVFKAGWVYAIKIISW